MCYVLHLLRHIELYLLCYYCCHEYRYSVRLRHRHHEYSWCLWAASAVDH